MPDVQAITDDSLHVGAPDTTVAVTEIQDIAPDTVTMHPVVWHVATRDTTVITIPQAPRDTVIDTDLNTALAATYSTSGIDTMALKIAVPPPSPDWEDGLEGTPRTINAGDNSGVLTIITAMFVVMMLGFRQSRRLFKVLFKELLGMRSPNVFDENTSNETGVLTIMAVQWSVYTGLLLYTFISLTHAVASDSSFSDITQLICLTSVYYVVQYIAYSLVGYTFTTPEGRRYFVEGFTASQSLLGFLLIIPALVALFYHQAAETMLITAGTLYLLARVIFIIKGFRIFYHKIWSLLYFILYLCTLEIVPLIVLYNVALSLVNSD